MTAQTSTDARASIQSIIQAAETLLRAGVLSNSLHGNISVRIPGTQTIALTARASLSALAEDEFAVLDLDGNVLSGKLEPTAHEIVHMHTTPYKLRPDVGSVIHTHSPYATVYAVASKPMECISEAMSRFEMTDPVPVAGYAPRGSKQAVDNIAGVITDRTKGILLENHGILTLGADANAAARVVIVMEETAFLGIHAAALGGAKLIPQQMLHASAERAAEFQHAGVLERGKSRI
jgi:L-fuculose-phosphate aldolase